MHTDAASLSDFVTLLQSLETDELRHPRLAYLRLHIQSKPDHQILCKLYHASGERRTAQTFVCWFPSSESIDVVNVHVPSGYLYC